LGFASPKGIYWLSRIDFLGEDPERVREIVCETNPEIIENVERADET